MATLLDRYTAKNSRWPFKADPLESANKELLPENPIRRWQLTERPQVLGVQVDDL